MTTKTFGTTLIELRKRKRLTQDDLARKARIQQTYLSGIENGERNVTLETILKLAHALNISPGEFFQTNALQSEKSQPKKVTFLKLGGTWDMIASEEGYKGTGDLDDEAFQNAEETVAYDETEMAKFLDAKFHFSTPIRKELGNHLFWVEGIEKLIHGHFIPLFSGDSSHYRPALYAPVLAYLFQLVKKDPGTPILIGVGTDTTDILLPLLDVFLFDQDVHPVLVTGANRSYRETHSDAPGNFYDLAQAVHLPLKPGAYYIFDHSIFRGSDIVKIDPREDPQAVDGLITFFAPRRTQKKLGFFEATEKNTPPKKYAGKSLSCWSTKELFEAMQKIITIDLGDMNDISFEIEKILDPKYPGVIVKSHALGNASNPIRLAVAEAVRNGKYVVNVSRCMIGEVNDRYYQSLNSAEKRIINGDQLNAVSAKAVLMRAFLEKKSVSATQRLVNTYVKSFYVH